MSFVLVFMVSTGALLELNTYDTLESCEAAKTAGMRPRAGNTSGEYLCIPKPD